MTHHECPYHCEVAGDKAEAETEEGLWLAVRTLATEALAADPEARVRFPLVFHNETFSLVLSRKARKLVLELL